MLCLAVPAGGYRGFHVEEEGPAEHAEGRLAGPSSPSRGLQGGGFRLVPFQALSRHTNHFAHKIGEGGFGSVYKGSMPASAAGSTGWENPERELPIAVKRLDQDELLAQFTGITPQAQFHAEVPR